MTQERKAELMELYVKERAKREREKQFAKAMAMREYRDYMRGVYRRNAKWTKKR